MTTERQLLKEAAETLNSLLGTSYVTIRSDDLEKQVKDMRKKINAHLSQPDAVAMTWEEALDKIASTVGYEYWSDLILREPLEDILTYCGAAHLFMESNRVQNIKAAGNGSDFKNIIAFGEFMSSAKAREYEALKVLKQAGSLTEKDIAAEFVRIKNKTTLDYFKEWQPLPEVPGVYLEGNK